MIWVKNSAGHRDVILTVFLGAFFLACVKILTAGMVITYGTFRYEGGSGAGDAVALVSSLLVGYVFRRYSDAKFAAEANAIEDADAEDLAQSKITRTRTQKTEVETPSTVSTNVQK